MGKNWSDFIKRKVQRYVVGQVRFTKPDLDWLERRNHCTIQEMKQEVILLDDLVFVDKQIRLHQGQPEERYACYLIYSNTRGRCYIITLNGEIKVISAYILGRTTINKYRKKFK